jgi:hypothetical protein
LTNSLINYLKYKYFINTKLINKKCKTINICLDSNNTLITHAVTQSNNTLVTHALTHSNRISNRPTYSEQLTRFLLIYVLIKSRFKT